MTVGFGLMNTYIPIEPAVSHWREVQGSVDELLQGPDRSALEWVTGILLLHPDNMYINMVIPSCNTAERHLTHLASDLNYPMLVM